LGGVRIDDERAAAAVASGDPLVEPTMRSLGAVGAVDDLYAESAAAFLAVRVLTCGVRPPKDGYGFGIQMGTRPQTLGYALVAAVVAEYVARVTVNDIYLLFSTAPTDQSPTPAVS
jgi:hypothetical protein